MPSADPWQPRVGDFRVLQVHTPVSPNDDLAWKAGGEPNRKSKQQLSSSSPPPSSSSVCISMTAWLPANKRRRRCAAATLWEPNPYLQTSGLIKQTECREGVNSCLITNESNDNNNHVPFPADVIMRGMKGIPRESRLQARQQLGQELRRQLVAKAWDELQTLSQPCLSSNTLSSFQASVSSVGAILWQRWASLYLSCPSVVRTLCCSTGFLQHVAGGCHV